MPISFTFPDFPRPCCGTRIQDVRYSRMMLRLVLAECTCQRKTAQSRATVRFSEIAYSVRHTEEHWTLEEILQTPGLSGMQWYTSDTAFVRTFPHGSCSKYQRPFEASSNAQYQKSRFNNPALPKPTPHPTALHALFLVSSQRNWNSYVHEVPKRAILRPTKRLCVRLLDLPITRASLR